MGAFLDVAVRDLLLAVAAYTLARLTEVRQPATAGSYVRKQEMARPSAA